LIARRVYLAWGVSWWHLVTWGVLSSWDLVAWWNLIAWRLLITGLRVGLSITRHRLAHRLRISAHRWLSISCHGSLLITCHWLCEHRLLHYGLLHDWLHHRLLHHGLRGEHLRLSHHAHYLSSTCLHVPSLNPILSKTHEALTEPIRLA
jgi:hypothetical protein